VKGKCPGRERSQNRFKNVKWNITTVPAVKPQNSMSCIKGELPKELSSVWEGKICMWLILFHCHILGLKFFYTVE